MKVIYSKWIKEPKDYRCMNCNAGNVTGAKFFGAKCHGSLIDHSFECICGATWTYITEGDRLHRYQFEYPREVV